MSGCSRKVSKVAVETIDGHGSFAALIQSGGEPPHSKTLSRQSGGAGILTGFGVRRLVAAFHTAFAIFIAVQLGRAAELTPNDVPPAIMREFRGAWIATVGNLNWPSKPGLSTDQQKAEL